MESLVALSTKYKELTKQIVLQALNHLVLQKDKKQMKY